MDEIEDFVDERQKSWCIYCGRLINELETNSDHVPSKALLLKPYPPNLPVIEAHKICNEGFSLDEEYLVAFLSSVLAGSTEPECQLNPKVKRALKRSTKLKVRIDHSKKSQKVDGETRIYWKPEWERVNRVIVKNARGHAYFEYGEPMLSDPEHVWAMPLETLTKEERAQFENIESGGGFPEVGSRMLTRVLTGQDLEDSWVIVQDGVYRFCMSQQGTILVKTVMFEYLATEVCWND